MKKSVLFLALIFAVACASPQNNSQPSQPEKVAETKTAVNAESPAKTENSAKTDEIVKRGAALGNSSVVQVSQVMENPKSYEGKTLTVEGKIARVCQEKGCWMELTEKEGDPGMRITFKDYGFFVPTNSQGKKVKAEGQVELKVMPKDQVDHLVGEGSKLKVNPDGTANTISLVANGVELYPTN